MTVFSENVYLLYLTRTLSFAYVSDGQIGRYTLHTYYLVSCCLPYLLSRGSVTVSV